MKAKLVALGVAQGLLLVAFLTTSFAGPAFHGVGILVGATALLHGILAGWLAVRPFAKQMRAMTERARALAAGVPLPSDFAGDGVAAELSELGRAVEAIVARHRNLVDEARAESARDTEETVRTSELERAQLEAQAHERAAEIRSRNEDLRSIFDHVAQGFLMLDRTGSVGKEHSRAIERWFGKPIAGVKFWDYVGAVDQVLGWRTKIGWDAVVEDFLPLELAIDQLPKAVTLGGAHLALEYRPIQHDDGTAKFLVVVSDVTNVVERENADAVQRELLCVLDHVGSDRAGFVGFMAEGGSLVRRIVTSIDDSRDVRRWLHTLKGNVGAFGQVRMARLCHAIEETMSESGRGPTAEDRAALARAWSELTSKVESLLREIPTDTLEIREAEHRWLLEGLSGAVSRSALLREVESWRLEPVHRPLERLADQARDFAIQLGKPGVHVKIDGGGVRVDSNLWGAFWAAMTHALRNALDHGLEPEADRARLGKPGPGTLAITAHRPSEDEIAIEVSDDGRGIDWENLAMAAHRAGLPYATAADLEELLFTDGLSTKRDVNMISGRGVGLSAARAACAALGGRVSVDSAPGKGTTFRFTFPATAASAPMELDEDGPPSTAQAA